MKFGGLLHSYATGGPLAQVPQERIFPCGVPGCEDGRIASQDESETVVECDTHDARTTHDTKEREERPQQVIRVQDQWRQHGTTRPR